MMKHARFICCALAVTVIGVILYCDVAVSLDLPASMKILSDEHMLVQSLGNEPGLYDDTVLRTIYLEFEQDDWWEQLNDNYVSKTEIPADLIMDGVTYPHVGVRIKGNSSYFMPAMSRLQKFSLNISMDYENPDQRLLDYKTLNLNNCFLDDSFVHEVLYCSICRNYTPCQQAGFVNLVINDENWGVYANVQQVNADFVDEWFLSSDGDRWKADSKAMGFGTGDSALRWLGSEVSLYEDAYELKTAKTDDPWTHLINVCDILCNTPLEVLPDTLDTMLNIDRTLWMLAMESVCADEDGYIHKGADYCLYYDVETERINTFQYDGNESFTVTNTFNPFGNGMESPFENEDEKALPLLHRLFPVPKLRQRYLAHMRTIVHEYFDWDVLEPNINTYRTLIEDAVALDTKTRTTYLMFNQAYSTMEDFITSRREYLLSHDELNRQALTIGDITCSAFSDEEPIYQAGEPVQVTAVIEGTQAIDDVLLYYGSGLAGKFTSVSMHDDGQHGDGDAGDRVYGAEIPPFGPGSPVRFYVEAVADDSYGTASYKPAGAEHNVYIYMTPIPVAESSAVVINELMASNTTTVSDPQGDYDDWIELVNTGSQTVDLTGCYLSDKLDNPMKWQFPDGTTIDSGEHLVVWADEDGSDTPGLHANFKLSADGEAVLLIDIDDHGNAILDSLSFGVQSTDVAYGRYPDGTGSFGILATATPGGDNAPVGIYQDIQPTSFELIQNYPNPFNNHTTISFTLTEPADTELSIYNLAGQKVATLVQSMMPAGMRQYVWDGCDSFGREMASGVYVYRLISGDEVQSQQLLLMK